MLYCMGNEAMSYYLQSIQSESIIYLLYTFTVLEYSFFCYFIYLVIPQSFIKKSVLFFWGGFILFDLVDLIFLNKGKGFDSFAIGIECIIVLFLCISYLFFQLRKSNSFIIYSTFNFWVVITFFMYFSGTFFLYIFAESMAKNVAFQKQYFIINISFNILKNILLCVAMTMKLNDTAEQQKDRIPNLDEDIFISENINFRN